MKMKVEKNDGYLIYFLMEGRSLYKARAENWCHGYQKTSGH